MVILSDTTNKNPKPKVTRAEGLSTFITYYSIVQSVALSMSLLNCFNSGTGFTSPSSACCSSTSFFILSKSGKS